MDVLEKDKDRQMLIQIAANSKHLDSLNTEDINILTEIFHLEKSQDQREAFHRLRNKLCEILIIEREHYQDYLKLPKFKRVKIETIDKITLFWQFIWLTFVHTKQEKAVKKIQIDSIGGMMKGGMDNNLSCFNYFPPYQPINQPKIPYPPYPYFYNFPNYQFPQFYPNNPNIKFNPYDIPTPPTPNFQIEQRIDNPQPKIIYKNEHISQSQNKKQNPPSNIINIQFLHCVCQGKNVEDGEECFTCIECSNCYHLGCIKLRKVMPKACPLCTLTKSNIFTQLITRPIKMGWLQLNKQEFFVTKIHFNQDQMNIFSQSLSFLQHMEDSKVLWIEFSILKLIDGTVANKKSNKISFVISSSQLKKVETRKWIELKLKQITHNCLAFYVISLMKTKQYQAIVNDYKLMGKQMNSIEFWSQQQRKEKRKIILNLTNPKTKKMIQLPVRGQLCDHLECQDLLQFYNNFKLSPFQNNKLQCSHCKNQYTPYSNFTSDITLYQMIQDRQEGNKSSRIGLSEQRRLEWVAYDPNEHCQSEIYIQVGEQMQSEA